MGPSRGRSNSRRLRTGSERASRIRASLDASKWRAAAHAWLLDPRIAGGLRARLRVAPALEAQPALANPALANPALANPVNKSGSTNQAPTNLVQSHQEWRGNYNPGPGEAETPVASTSTGSSGVSPAPDAVTENHTSQVLAASATADSSAGAWGHLQSRSEIGERVGRPFSSSGPVSVEAANSSLEARSAVNAWQRRQSGAALHAGAPVVESNNTAARTGNGERELTAANDQSSPSHSRPSTAASDSIGSDSLGEAGIHPQGKNSQTSSRDAREPETDTDEHARGGPADRNRAPDVRGPVQPRPAVANPQWQREESDDASPAVKLVRPQTAERENPRRLTAPRAGMAQTSSHREHNRRPDRARRPRGREAQAIPARLRRWQPNRKSLAPPGHNQPSRSP